MKWAKSLKSTNYQSLLKKNINTMNSTVSIKEIEFVVKNFPKRKTPEPDDFPLKFYPLFKKKKIQWKLF